MKICLHTATDIADAPGLIISSRSRIINNHNQNHASSAVSHSVRRLWSLSPNVDEAIFFCRWILLLCVVLLVGSSSGHLLPPNKQPSYLFCHPISFGLYNISFAWMSGGIAATGFPPATPWCGVRIAPKTTAMKAAGWNSYFLFLVINHIARAALYVLVGLFECLCHM